jgi:phospholipid/cholesterol/gamma-HCH transport system substrate-binding protein
VDSGPSEEELRNAIPPRVGGKELRIGIFVLAGILSSTMALYLLTDPSTFRGRYVVTTVVPDAGGLRTGDPVQMRGVNIGQVSAFRLEGNGVEVSLEIEGQWQVPSDSRVRLVTLGLLGGRIADVLPGSSTEALRAGGVLPGVIVEGLNDAAGELGGQAEVVLQRLQELLSATTVEAVRVSATELQGLLEGLSEVTDAQGREVSRLMASLNRSAAGLEEATSAGPEVARAIARADSTMTALNETSATLNGAVTTLQSILDRLDRGEGTLGKLATDDSLYTNLNRALESVQQLATDLREHPERYLKLAIF